MLSEFQNKKFAHFFNILDFNGNGVISREDFESIGENLCVLWGFKEGTGDYDLIMRKCHRSWDEFIKFTGDPQAMQADVSQWLGFCELKMMSIDEAAFSAYVSRFVGEIFDYFDANGDGYISLEEYIDLFMAYRIEIRYSAKSFTKLDLNGDGLLGKDELVSAVSEFFRGNSKDDPGNWLFGFWEY